MDKDRVGGSEKQVKGAVKEAGCAAAPSLSASNTAFAISSTKRGIPSVRSTRHCQGK